MKHATYSQVAGELVCVCVCVFREGRKREGVQRFKNLNVNNVRLYEDNVHLVEDIRVFSVLLLLDCRL